MEPVSGNYSRNMERLEGDVSRRSRRKRRRRRRRREGDTLSTLIRTIEHWDSAASSSEDGSSTSSLEVKENQDEKILEERDVLRIYHPSAFCPGFNRVGQRALKRKRLVDGRDGLFRPNSWTYRRSAWAVTQKNAVVQLNELKPGLMYETVSKTGPLHAPVFSVAVELNGFHFEGQGPTKKQAKMRAAELALQSFIQFPNASQAHAAMGNFSSTAMDFTADKLDLPDGFLTEFDLLYCNSSEKEVFSSVYNHRRALRFGLDVVSSNPRRQPVSTSVLGHLSPVALLDELRPGLRYMCQVEEVGGRPMRNYIMMVRVDGRVFEGCGRSKRQSKAQAAAAALQSVCNVSLGPERTLRGLQGGRTKNQLPQFFAESIYQLVKEKHSQLTDACSSSSSVCHKVLAGVVMTRGFDLRSARVVSLATGTKCLDLDDLSDLGCTLTDCHAEVLSRRALVQFLYSQLELQVFSDKPAEGEEQSIFTPSQGGFRLQDGVLFHMYVSSSPCGDARLHSPYETSAAYPSRRFCCHLRVKVNGGEGTLPVNVRRANQRRTSVSPGKPVGSMSCTDKMAKWSVVGLQGALLSHLVEPIYLHSLTVGTLSHSGHLGRVMGRRLAPVKHLPFPYRRQQLLLGCLSSREVRMAGKAPDVSVSWSYGNCSLEEVSSSTGRRKDSGTPSQLCRRSLFARWLRLQEKVNGLMLGTEATAGTYSLSKMSAGRYQRALQQFSSSLQVGRLGTWIRKPLNLGHFSAGLGKTAP